VLYRDSTGQRQDDLRCDIQSLLSCPEGCLYWVGDPDIMTTELFSEGTELSASRFSASAGSLEAKGQKLVPQGLVCV
jgi:hypothetical protein